MTSEISASSWNQDRSIYWKACLKLYRRDDLISSGRRMKLLMNLSGNLPCLPGRVLRSWERCFCGEDVIHVIYVQIRKCNGCQRIACRSHKDSESAAGEGPFRDAELIPSVEEQSHLASNCPNAYADFPRRSRCISALDRFIDGQPCPATDPFRADLSITG